MAIGGRWGVQIVGDAQRRLEQASRDCEKAIMQTVNEAAAVVQREAKENVRTKLNTTGTAKGVLRRSIKVVRDTSELSADIGTDVIYGRIHEFGGTIKPVKAKFLAIPVGNLKGSPRQHNLALATTLKGQYVLVDGAGEVQYILRKEVVIPERPYLRPALEDKRPVIKRKFNDLLRKLGL